MYKKFILLIIVTALLLTACSSTGDKGTSGDKENDKIIEATNKDIVDEELPKYKAILPQLDFGMSYKEVIDVLGEPDGIINIEDEGLIILKGYFMLLVYDHIELIMYNSNYEKKFDISDSTIIQIDITKAHVNDADIKVGDSIEVVKNQYDLKGHKIDAYEESDFYRSLVRNYRQYDAVEVYFLHGGVIGEMPVVIAIYVDESNIITRIVLGLPTAG
ncbi:hypothetical protein [Alkaliphilus peptidifermentans]|uniref:Uncharacterized protein n=1 Tax=Alkaliphilus peptidifermentans DSM 18978 TaxID=1120976 RepID=A0A1G5GHX5_9FIRM|nr:hypothetical protein [Alkaliphilus peptidifermentans]SCY50957.1 hypothetical protein SAMN03080606_01692 [Alkaliphilus peptidifermentans DSM 18978]